MFPSWTYGIAVHEKWIAGLTVYKYQNMICCEDNIDVQVIHLYYVLYI